MSTALELALPNLPDAACRDLPGLFDDSVEGETRKEKARRYAEARMVCQRCPELDACRALVKADESLATGVIVWGGLAFHRPVLASKNARAIGSLPGLDRRQNPACGKPLTSQQRAKRRRNCSTTCREAARNARRKPDRAPTGLIHCQHCQKPLSGERRVLGAKTCNRACRDAAASVRQRERRAAARTGQVAATLISQSQKPEGRAA